MMVKYISFRNKPESMVIFPEWFSDWFWDNFWRASNKIYNYGTVVYEKDWDVLILLDGCRFDAFEEMRGEFKCLGKNTATYSIASSSQYWMEKTFSGEYNELQKQTAYVTGNPFSQDYLKKEAFAFFDPVWKYAWDDDAGTIRPRPITDRSIDVWREHAPEKMIIHYMQPHYPFLTDLEITKGIELEHFGDLPWDSIWVKLRNGSVSMERVWSAYLENLTVVLKEIALLAENIAADDVIISADHGNAFGEFGQYGHPNRTLNPYVRKVPWCRVDVTDEHTYEPTLDQPHEVNDLKSNTELAEDRLEDLGYL